MNRRVLLVDDREDNLYFLRSLLEGNGYKVVIAHDGVQALEAARRERPDLVISDLLMPVMDGYTLLREWRADGELGDVPFIVYTATYTEEDDEALAVRLGADEFLVKPTEPDKLLAVVSAVSARERPRSGAENRDPKPSPGQDTDPGGFQAYSRVLVHKLEQKTLQLKESNQELAGELAERVRAEKALHESLALLRMAGKVSRLGGWVLDAVSRRLTWSEETCRLYGKPEGFAPDFDEALAFVAAEYRDEVQRSVRACLEHGESFDTEAAALAVDGRRMWVRIIGEAMRSGTDGPVVGVQGAIQDISERKAMEERLLRASRMESIAVLTGGMAHDLNNVLTPILLAVTTLQDGEHDAETTHETLAIIESCAERGADMVRQVLSFARGHDRATVSVKLDGVLSDLRRAVRDTFPPSVNLDIRVPENLWELAGDPTQIHQVLLNLAANARDAMPDGGRITISAENVMIDEHYAAMCGRAMPGPHVRVTVEDAGCGIPEDHMEKIFDPLFTTKAEDKGTGLGLATVAEIMRGHHGSVNAYSDVGVGTTFRLHFPALVAHHDALPVATRMSDWHGHDRLVLVVDDEAAIRTLTQHVLEAFGYRVITAVDGADAVTQFLAHRDEIAVVLTDFVMPQMDGAELIHRLRELAPGVRIIAASGHGADIQAAHAAAAAGADCLVQKPFTAETLLDAVQRAICEVPDDSHAPDGSEGTSGTGAH